MLQDILITQNISGMTMSSPKIKVGQKVYIKTYGNARRRLGDKILDDVITKVGRKYFEVENLFRIRFFIKTMLNDGNGYACDYHCYLNRKEIEDEQEYSKLGSKFRDIFQHSKLPLTLSQLREIDAITKQKKQ